MYVREAHPRDPRRCDPEFGCRRGTGRELVELHGGVTGLGRTGETVPARLAWLWALCVIAELLECLGFEFVRKAGAFCSGA